MLRKLFRVLGPDATTLRWLLAALVACAVLQGIAFSLLVPLVRAVLDGDHGTAWTWVAIEAGILLLYGAAHYASRLWAMRVSASLSSRLWQRLGDHLSNLPLGWFDTSRTGAVSRLTSHGVFVVIGFPTNMLRPLRPSAGASAPTTTRAAPKGGSCAVPPTLWRRS